MQKRNLFRKPVIQSHNCCPSIEFRLTPQVSEYNMFLQTSLAKAGQDAIVVAHCNAYLLKLARLHTRIWDIFATKYDTSSFRLELYSDV